MCVSVAFGAAAGVAVGQTFVTTTDRRICDTEFIASPGSSLEIASNWSNGLPHPGWVACFPDVAGLAASKTVSQGVTPLRITSILRRSNAGGVAGDSGGSSSPIVVYNNEVDPVDAFYRPGAGQRLADDLFLTGSNCGIVSYELMVFGRGVAAIPTYDASVALWDGDPCDSASSVLPGTGKFFSDLPNDGETAVVLEVSLPEAAPVSGTVWMTVTFSNSDAGWVVAQRAETGFTADWFSENDSTGCNRFAFSDGNYGGFWAKVSCRFGGIPDGACCVRSECVLGDAFDCREMGGYFLEDVIACFETTCGSGACCRGEDASCVDDDGFGGPMDEELCAIIGGDYLGDAECGASDPCQRYRLPEGFELVPAISSDGVNHKPRINDCGQIVLSPLADSVDDPVNEVFVYDNGLLTQITDEPDTANNFADINNQGTIVWTRGYDGWGRGQIMMLKDGEVRTISDDGIIPRINRRGPWPGVVGIPTRRRAT